MKKIIIILFIITFSINAKMIYFDDLVKKINKYKKIKINKNIKKFKIYYNPKKMKNNQINHILYIIQKRKLFIGYNTKEKTLEISKYPINTKNEYLIWNSKNKKNELLAEKEYMKKYNKTEIELLREMTKNLKKQINIQSIYISEGFYYKKKYQECKAMLDVN